MVVISTLISGFSASKRSTAACWNWLRPDSVCWLSQNCSVIGSWAVAVPATMASDEASKRALRKVPSHGQAVVECSRQAAARPVRRRLGFTGLLVGDDHPHPCRCKGEAVGRQGAGIGDQFADRGQRGDAMAGIEA